MTVIVSMALDHWSRRRFLMSFRFVGMLVSTMAGLGFKRSVTAMIVFMLLKLVGVVKRGLTSGWSFRLMKMSMGVRIVSSRTVMTMARSIALLTMAMGIVSSGLARRRRGKAGAMIIMMGALSGMPTTMRVLVRRMHVSRLRCRAAVLMMTFAVTR